MNESCLCAAAEYNNGNDKFEGMENKVAVTDMAEVLWCQTGYWVMVMDVC